MAASIPKILLTGLPGCGKTTAIIQIVEDLKDIKVAGFYTQEIRQNNKRKGFRWTSLDGNSGILAHVNIKGLSRVGRYGVDVAGFEESVVPIIDIEQKDVELFVIDEIGKMECMSEKFVAAVKRLFASDKSLLVTVAQKGGGLISEVKSYPCTKIFHLTHHDYNKIVAEILQILSSRKNKEKTWIKDGYDNKSL
jgi:nucleoside-triphosphatase